MAKGSSGPSTHSILEKSYTWRWNTILILILKRVDLTAGKVSNSIFRGPPTHPPELTFLNKKWPVEAPKFTNVSQCTDTDLITPKLSCSRPAHMRKLSSDQSFILLSVSYLTEGLSIGGRSDQELSANPFTPLIGFLCSSTTWICTKAGGNNLLTSVSIECHSPTGNDLKKWTCQWNLWRHQ